jgi:serine/threonine protein kinase
MADKSSISTRPETLVQPDTTGLSQSAVRYSEGDFLGDHYQIVQVIPGGMGIVYKVIDTRHRWFLAAKTSTSLEEKKIEQFQMEIQNLIELPPYPHVVQVDSVRSIDNKTYVFMEFIEGGSLYAKLNQSEQHKLDFGIVINYAMQLCRGLRFIQDKGHILHLDVKPANILIDLQGILKISDFGISRFSPMLTRKNISPGRAGTPEYMSPEQLKGERVDVWSDIYSFGLVFYEMFVGKLPYPFDVASARSSKTLREQLLSFHNSEYDFHREFSHRKIIGEQPDEVGTIIGHCLAKSPGNRVIDFRYLERWIEREFGQYAGSVPTPLQGVDFYRKALNLQAIGKHSKALEWFNHALRMNQNDPEIWEAAAESCAAMGMQKEETYFRDRAKHLIGRRSW